MRHHTLLVGLALIAVTAAHAGPEWCEPNPNFDAGPLPPDAIAVTGAENVFVTKMDGELEGNLGPLGDFQDMFLIQICDPFAFTATVDIPTGFDTRLWLFRFDETGLLGNDDNPTLVPLSYFPPGGANDGSGAAVTSPGLYYLAISGTASDPVSGGGAIFSSTTPTEVSGPDGGGGSAAVSGWMPTVGATGAYTIDLTGVVFIHCPEDLDGNGSVGFSDILALLADWGPCAGCAADLDGNGTVAFADLLILLAEWGRCEEISGICAVNAPRDRSAAPRRAE